MTDVNAIARAYVALWNERDEARRAAMLEAGWTQGAVYRDPLATAAGLAEISALIGATQERFPNFNFTLIGKPDGYGDQARFSWALGPGDYVDAPIEGTDFVRLAEGRLAAVTGFLDKLPVM